MKRQNRSEWIERRRSSVKQVRIDQISSSKHAQSGSESIINREKISECIKMRRSSIKPVKMGQIASE